MVLHFCGPVLVLAVQTDGLLAQEAVHTPAGPWLGSQIWPLQSVLLPQPQAPASVLQTGVDGGQSVLVAHVQLPLTHCSLPGQSLERLHWPQEPSVQPGMSGGQSAGRRHSTQAC